VISEDRLQKALTYLASTDEPSAELKGNVARQEYVCKLVRAQEYVLAQGTAELRKAIAEKSQRTVEAQNTWANAIVEFEKIKAKRATEELIVEVWRSINANRRQGNV
jgi:hypothetical protein